jgi:hypothetical protein
LLGFFAGFATAAFGLVAIAAGAPGWAATGGAIFDIIVYLIPGIQNKRNLSPQGLLTAGLLGAVGWFLGDPILWHLK